MMAWWVVAWGGQTCTVYWSIDRILLHSTGIFLLMVSYVDWLWPSNLAKNLGLFFSLPGSLSSLVEYREKGSEWPLTSHNWLWALKPIWIPHWSGWVQTLNTVDIDFVKSAIAQKDEQKRAALPDPRDNREGVSLLAGHQHYAENIEAYEEHIGVGLFPQGKPL